MSVLLLGVTEFNISLMKRVSLMLNPHFYSLLRVFHLLVFVLREIFYGSVHPAHCFCAQSATTMIHLNSASVLSFLKALLFYSFL